MQITRYRWSDCTHIEHVDDSGQPMTWIEVKDPVNNIFDADPPYDCPACEDPEGTHPGISIMPRVPEKSRQATTATPLNPIVDSFTPSQAMPYHHKSNIAADNYLDVQQDVVDAYPLIGSAENYLAAQQAMINPYASTVSGADYLAVQQALPDPYSSAFTGDDYSAVQQTALVPYESTFPSHDYSAVQQVLLNPYASTAPVNTNENFATQHAQEYHQQFYSRNGQAIIAPFYGPTGPIGFAATVPTSGPTSQVASVSPHHAPVENTINAKNATKLPQHKPGKECPEENTNCHWHYTGWCHKNPATCPLALQAITASFHAHGEWRHAPAGWNEAHQSCIRVDNPVMCPFHAQLARRVLGSSVN